MTTPIFEARGLEKAWGGRPIVRGLSFDLRPGEVVGLLGPNGAGKTTAFYMTIGLVRPDRGECLWQGEDVTSWPIHRRARAGIGYLAQEPSVFRQLTVAQNLQAILETLPLTKKERALRQQTLLEELHLCAFAHQVAATLSGGQRRRVEIARALVTQPRLLLLDEPFANIDPLTIQDLKQMIRYLSARGISVLITDHNAREILSFVHRVTLVVDGQTLASGTPEELARHPLARERYLGSEFGQKEAAGSLVEEALP